MGNTVEVVVTDVEVIFSVVSDPVNSAVVSESSSKLSSIKIQTYLMLVQLLQREKASG